MSAAAKRHKKIQMAARRAVALPIKFDPEKAARRAVALPIKLAPETAIESESSSDDEGSSGNDEGSSSDDEGSQEFDSGYSWNHFKKGQMVQAYWEGWHNARILVAHRTSKTFTIAWSDGTFSEYVRPQFIRPKPMKSVTTRR